MLRLSKQWTFLSWTLDAVMSYHIFELLQMQIFNCVWYILVKRTRELFLKIAKGSGALPQRNADAVTNLVQSHQYHASNRFRHVHWI